jgi:NAD(P)-dependent dehydrogenase (short-subunit alcohol dehydrogenase family)
LANVLFSKELTKRMNTSHVCVTSLHPGEVATEIWRKCWAWVQSLVGLFLMSEDTGALTTLYCATAPEVVDKKNHGGYFVSLFFGLVNGISLITAFLRCPLES